KRPESIGDQNQEPSGGVPTPSLPFKVPYPFTINQPLRQVPCVRGDNVRFSFVSPCRNTDFPAMPWQISCTLTLIDYTLMAACAASSSCRDGGYQNQYPEHWVNGAEEHVFM
ncbi:hypothetical protein L7H84_43175, partial [Klebsiella pneumoniae]|nr:hypothetical protein [Klebsiella pneumoniae]